jgi:Uma2 family endonuclease
MTIETSGRRPSRQYEPPLMSWEEFLAWARRQERRFEWVDGEIVEFLPDSTRHLLLVRFIFLLIHEYVEQRRLGLTLFSGLLMRLPQRPSGRVPDVTFVSTERLNRLFDTYFEGPVDLAVEVISPDSTRRDYHDKLAEYEAAGIREYWLIDSLQARAWFYVLGEDGKYHEAPISADGIYTSTVLPGLRLRVDWLWRDTLPTVGEALADLPE